MTPWTAACQAPLSFTISWSLLKFMLIESVMPSNHLILCCPLLCLQSSPADYDLFQWVSSSFQVAKYWSFSISLPVNIQDWFPLGLTGLISLQSKELSTVVKNLPANAGGIGDTGSIPGLGRIPRKWQPTTIFLSGKFHGQRSLVSYRPWGHKESDVIEHAACTHI